MHKLDENQMELAREILKILVGQSAQSAKEILKAVNVAIQVAAIVKGDFDE